MDFFSGGLAKKPKRRASKGQVRALNKFAILACVGLVLGLSGCSQAPKDNVKACEIQHQIYTEGLALKTVDASSFERFVSLSKEAEALAEPELALELGYQTDFFTALADPNTQQGWTPSQEMNTAKVRLGDICRTYGFTFD